eukprot:72481_1
MLSDWSQLSDIIRDIVIVLWTGIISIILIYKFECTDNKTVQSKTAKYSSLICMISFCIGYTTNSVQILSSQRILRWILFICVNTACFALYILIFSRLYYSFNQSVYAISNTVLYSHLIILITLEILFIAQSIFDYRDIR